MGELSKTNHLRQLVESFDTAMLITRHADQLHARPMAIAEIEGTNVIWFATSADSPKTAEMRDDSRVSITLQSDRQFVALSGTGTLVRDRTKIDALWKEAWKVWFPNGKDDPSLALISVRVEDAEFWDNSGAKGIRYAFEAAKGFVRGERPEPVSGSHGRIQH